MTVALHPSPWQLAPQNKRQTSESPCLWGRVPKPGSAVPTSPAQTLSPLAVLLFGVSGHDFTSCSCFLFCYLLMTSLILITRSCLSVCSYRNTHSTLYLENRVCSNCHESLYSYVEFLCVCFDLLALFWRDGGWMHTKQSLYCF